jgi:hypothetical protein
MRRCSNHVMSFATADGDILGCVRNATALRHTFGNSHFSW